MVKSRYSIFFDDGGVINDNEVRGPQWWKLIAEYFIPKYGKTSDEWKAANRHFLDGEIKYWNDLLEQKELIDMPKFMKNYYIRWVKIMFDYLELPAPNSDGCIRISREASDWIMPQIQAAYPGMNEVIRNLGLHFNLYTSSGADNRTLNTYYKAQGIDTSFTKILGSDTVGVFKSHPTYFDRLFKMVDVEPRNSIVIDDNEKVLGLIQKNDVKCIVSDLSGKSEISGNYPVFRTPEELIEIISKITKVNLSSIFVEF